MTRFLLAIGATLAVGLGFAADPPAGVELLLPGPRPTRLSLHVEIDGVPVAHLWDGAFAAVFAFHDRDGNGALDPTEAARVPTPFQVRQVAWGRYAGPTGDPPAFIELDADRDGRVSPPELAGFYRRAGLGGVLVGVGTPPGGDALTDAILKRIDADADGTPTAAEWAAAADRLRALDANDDEMISPAELVPGAAYPGSLGGTLLAPGRPTPFPLTVLSHDRPIPSAADVVWHVRFGPKADDAGRVDAVGGAKPADGRLAWAGDRLRFDLWPAAGKLPSQAAAARSRLEAQFAEFDANADGALDAAERGAPKAASLRPVTAAADRDVDGTLTRAEFAAWLDLQDRLAQCVVLLTVTDRGAGLFEVLDADQDGGLSVRELRTAGARLAAAGLITADGFARDRLPRQWLGTIARGHPTSVARRPARGPEWFRAMDRNGDGDVSRREFLGPPAAFDARDADRDGLLDADEAGRPDRPS